jgi:predicted ester cyclase
MSANGNKDVLRRLAAAINGRNLDALDKVFAVDYVRHDPSDLLREVGVKEYKEAFRRLLRAFPNAQWTCDELLEDGDKVIGRWTFRGTNTGPFFNLPPTGREVPYPIIAVYRIENGRIAEDWHVFHAPGLWQQLIPEIGDLLAEARGR